ncbi:unnamed protein product [Urochloa humidicola]
MAARRLLFQSKFFGMSRPASVIGAHASAARAGAAPPARYFNVFPRSSHPDAKTSLATTGVPSAITNGMKPGFLDFAKVVKRTFSSSASKSNNHKFTMEAEMAARRACEPLSVSQQIKRDVDTTIVLMTFTCIGILYMSANDSTRTNNGSSRCSNCRNCQCQVQ